jgi:hypothetical protein
LHVVVAKQISVNRESLKIHLALTFANLARRGQDFGNFAAGRQLK